MAYSNYGINAYSNYAGGDYYRGDYYRGYAAGGIFGSIGRAIGGAVKGFVKGGPIGALTGAAGAVLKRSPGTAVVPAPPTFPTMMPGGLGPLMVPKGTPGATKKPGITGVIERTLPGGETGYVGGAGGAPGGYHWNKTFSYARGLPAGSFLVRNRSLNPANARALRRGVRRQQAFIALARRVMKGTGMTIKRSGMGGPRRRARK
jgi:hypothetical protein